MHVLGGGTRQYESDEKRIGAVRQLMTQHNASVFSALSSDILVTDIPVQAGDEWPHVVPETRSVFHQRAQRNAFRHRGERPRAMSSIHGSRSLSTS